MKYKIAIPSYKRQDIIQEKTLNYLKECGIPSNLIDIFVANEEEFEIYKEKVPSKLYNKLIIGTETLYKQRNYIRHHYKDNEHLVCIDDDISCLYIKNKTFEPYYDLDKLIKFGFNLCHNYKTNLWGIYPVFNDFFMSQTISYGLYFIVGAFYGIINNKNSYYDLTIPNKHDYELTIKEYLKTNKVLRFDNITVKTNYYTEKGGLMESRTEETIKYSAKKLLERYPQFVELNKNRKKHTEIKLKRQPNNQKIKLRDI